ncbi:YcbK family protein [Neisseria sp. Ec49-e6-T10]|uniref:YcbK family protein n=1 Tax=Neisseria sp. Ec49-e6-T10 TaxID=3140744 RepID=UPI003EBEE013
MNRRAFLKQAIVGTVAVATSGSILTAAILCPGNAIAETIDQSFWYKDRFLEIRRADTGEKQLLCFYRNGQYDAEQYKAACWLFRDAKDQNSMVSMDVGLFNLLYGMQEWARQAGVSNPLITLNSGHRTARRNQSIEGAAHNSLHIPGQAADITMRGVTINQIVAMAKHYHVGGVGTYSSFVHIDTGRVRFWRG